MTFVFSLAWIVRMKSLQYCSHLTRAGSLLTCVCKGIIKLSLVITNTCMGLLQHVNMGRCQSSTSKVNL